jgi:hypothetical protein
VAERMIAHGVPLAYAERAASVLVLGLTTLSA